MAKRKSSNTKSKSATKGKIGRNEISNQSSSDNNILAESNESKVGKIPESDTNDNKLENFKKQFGMIKDESIEKNWIKERGYLVYNPVDLAPSNKIASFDLDETIIMTKSGKKFPESWADWKIMHNEIPDKLKSLQNDGYKLVIFTNQGGVEKKKINENDLKRKIVAILEKLGLSIQIFVSIAYGTIYRKPCQGMFELLLEKYNSNIPIKLEESFYVGDGAGRPAEWDRKKKKDFSCSDRLFAINSGLKFYTPEEYFLNQKPAPFNMPAFNPLESVRTQTHTVIKYNDKTYTNFSEILPTNNTEPVLIVMVGSPASGKSTFCKNHLVPLQFNVVNRDTLNTWQKCVAETKRLLKEKKNVVIDNTNPDVEARGRYVSVALESGLKHIICCVMDLSEGQCRHNEMFRQLTFDNHDKISELVFRTFKSKYQEPSNSEKFSVICKIVPALHFMDEHPKSLYSRYLCDN